MSQMITFDFDMHSIAIQVDDRGEPWFSLPAICRVTGHTNPSMAGARIPDDEKTALNIADPTGRLQPTMFVNEAGMYRLVLTSRMPAAERFKTWIVREVLPSIRKTGSYGQPAVVDLRDPRQMAAAALQLIEINTELKSALDHAQARVATLSPKAQAYDDLCESDGTYTLENAGRIIGSNGSKMGPRLFIEWMRNNGFLFYQDRVLVPYGKFVTQGLFKVKARDVDGKMRAQTYVTPKGLAHFHRMLNPQGDLLLINTGGAA